MLRGMLAFWFVSTLGLTAADRSDAELRQLFEARRWFELRDAVQHREAPAFYRIVVSCAFDDVQAAERWLRPLVKSGARASDTLEAHGLLASAHMRAGRYRQALSHLEAMQALNPEYAGLTGALRLFRALSRNPQPVVAKRGRTELRMSPDLFIPLSINAVPAQYGFDTGMDISVMSVAEARRLRLRVSDVSGSEFQDGASGEKVGIRIAVAEQLVLGKFKLTNVPFLVVDNDAMPFVELPADKQGIIGFPVLRACGSMGWDKSGNLRLGYPAQVRSRAPNMCMPGNSMPVVEGLFRGRKINLVLDTGASKSVLTPRFARDFPEVVANTGKQDVRRLTGLGGSTEVEVIRLPEFRFSAGRFDFFLRPADVLPHDQRVDRNAYHVWVGMDLLGEARSVTMDFDALEFAAE